MLTKRLKVSDYWIYPQPITTGQWRVCKLRPYNRAIQRQHIKPNRFAWRQRQQLFDYSDPDYVFSDEYFDEEANGGALQYWAMDVPGLPCDHCPDRNICLEHGCEND